jgi:hypothetical protein
MAFVHGIEGAEIAEPCNGIKDKQEYTWMPASMTASCFMFDMDMKRSILVIPSQ